MRLIDADELIKTLESFMDLPDPGYAMGIGRAIWLVKDAPTIPAPQWISVEDRLPGENGQYIVTACDEGEPYDKKIWNDTVVVCAVYYKSRWTWEKNNIEYSLDGIVTHWMPLPTNPKDGGE